MVYAGCHEMGEIVDLKTYSTISLIFGFAAARGNARRWPKDLALAKQ